MNVNIDKCCHQELTVKSVHDASMTWDDVFKVLDLECSLESRSKESSEGSNDGGKERHEETVDEERVECDCFLHVKKSPPGRHCLWQRVFLNICRKNNLSEEFNTCNGSEISVRDESLRLGNSVMRNIIVRLIKSIRV